MIKSRVCWAVDPRSFESLKASLLRGQAEAKKFGTFFGFPSSDMDSGVPVFLRNGVATVKIHGPLLMGADIFDRLFTGAIDTAILTETIRNLGNNDEVQKIILDIDSPGGDVAGIGDAANAVYELREKKDVEAYTPWSMASAAYWIGSAAKTVYASQQSMVGSIGVIYTHVDESGFLESMGVKITNITTGKYKALGDPASPLSEEDAEELKKYINAIFESFIGDVERFRGIKKEDIVSFEGNVFIGKNAIEVGLVDYIGYPGLNSTGKDASKMGIRKKEKDFRAEADPQVDKSDDQIECEANGKYWYDDGCHDEPKGTHNVDGDESESGVPDAHPAPANASATSRFKAITEEECKEKDGYKWVNNQCVKEEGDGVDASGKRVAELAAGMARETAAFMWETAFRGTSLPEDVQTDIKALVCYKNFINPDGSFKGRSFARAIQKKIDQYEGYMQTEDEGLIDDTGFEGVGSYRGKPVGNVPDQKNVKAYIDRLMGING